MNKWWYKVGFYLLSMFFFLVIVMILGTDVPVYFGEDWVFLGCQVLLQKGVMIPIICLLLIICIFFFYVWLNNRKESSRLGPVTDTKFENVGGDVMSFVASYFFPLVSFNLGTTWRHIVVLGILFVIIGIIYIKANIYYCNPTLLIWGFRVYKAKGYATKEGKDKKCQDFDKTIIIWGKMKDGDKFKYIPIDEKTCFAYRQ